MSPVKERIAYHDAALDDVRDHLTPPVTESEVAEVPAVQPETAEQPMETSQAAADLPAEMEGAYSSLGNRHTYVKDENGRARSIKRADALEKADEFVANREQSVDSPEPAAKGWTEMSDEEQLDHVKAKGYKNAFIDKDNGTIVAGELSDDSADRQEVLQAVADSLQAKINKDSQAGAETYDPGDKPTDDLIKDWAHAEINGNTEIAKLVQDELQERIIASQEAGDTSEEEISPFIDSLDQEKEAVKARILQAHADRDEKRETRALKNDLTAEAEEGTTASEEDAEAWVAGAENDGDDEDIVVESRAERRSFRDRIKDRLNLLQIKYATRERREGEPWSRNKKIAVGLGVVALAALSYKVFRDPGAIDAHSTAAEATTEAVDNPGVDAIANVDATPDVVSFSFDKPYQPGDPGLWSFVQSQGVPAEQVNNLLNEWNPDYDSIARGLQIGEKVDIPVELIEKYKQV